jgi:hypothetical protein
MVDTSRSPILGVALLDNHHVRASFGRFSPEQREGLGSQQPGSFECPATWPVPTVHAVAGGAGPEPTLRGSAAAVAGLEEAVKRLAPEVDLITTNCGFFWSGWRKLRGEMRTPLLLSGLDFLDVALGMTTGPVGVLTYSEECLREMLKEHPQLTRLRIVGYSDLPAWAAIRVPDYVARGGWSPEALQAEFLERTRAEFGRGRLRDIAVLVLECTGMPQYRSELRKLTTVPIFDVHALATALLT